MKRKNLFAVMAVSLIIMIMLTVLAVLFFYGNTAPNAADTIKRAEEPTAYNLLLLGRDKAAGLCDVIMLVSFNVKNGEANIMQIPRDTYFNYTKGSYKKINGALNAYGSVESFANAVGDSLGLNIDYYLALDIETVKNMVDMLSGIELNIPFDMSYHDPEQNLHIEFKAGKQILDGNAALEFLRYRAGYLTGDLGRLDAQKLFMDALIDRLEDENNPKVYVNLLKLFINNGETNIREQDLLKIGIKASKNKGGEVYFMTAPGEAVQSNKSGAWYYVLSAQAMAEVISSRFVMSKEGYQFDKDKKFVDNETKSFYDIYNKYCEYKIYSADEIKSNGLNIN